MENQKIKIFKEVMQGQIGMLGVQGGELLTNLRLAQIEIATLKKEKSGLEKKIEKLKKNAEQTVDFTEEKPVKKTKKKEKKS